MVKNKKIEKKENKKSPKKSSIKTTKLEPKFRRK